nr:hypothetical protein [Chitinophagaceae bacterium]
MRKCFFTTLFSMVFLITVYSQEREKEAHYYYLSLGTSVYTNTPGTFGDKTFITAEFGRTFGIFDIGILMGKLNLSKHVKGTDSTFFTELLPTINVFSKGRFSEALTLGAGYIFNASENFLTEITNSIN